MEIERLKFPECQYRSFIIANYPHRRIVLSLEDGMFEQRAARVREIEALGFSPFGKRFDFTNTIPGILRDYHDKPAEELSTDVRVRLAGRVQTVRRMGKAGFAHIRQNGGAL